MSQPAPQSPLLEATETTALLAEPSSSHNGAPAKLSPRGLPTLQILLLCYARMVEPIAFFAIFPFIAQMVQRNGGLPDSDVGFYSGLIESLFSATQMVVLIYWGRLADRLGRRPLLLTSLVGMSVGSMLFGTARSLWEMILFRCLAGVFSGSGLIIRTMIAELSTTETQARAFSWFAFSSNLGIFVGPLIGGALADPATQYPGVFKGIRFFEEYPYALPGFVTGGISATGAIVNAMFLKETLHKEEASDGQSEAPKRLSVWELIKFPSVPTVLFINGQVMFLAFAFTALLPVVLFTPVPLGGLGLTSFQISIYMAAQGASQALWLLLVFPPLQYRVGTKGVLRICAVAYPFFFCGYIIMNLLLREGSHVPRVWFWIVGCIVALVGPGVAMAFTAVQLAINEASPNPQVLGTLNAIALTGSSAIRAVVPGVTTAVYAAGVRGQILGGHLVWVILIPLSMGYYAILQYLPEGRIPAKQVEEDED